MVTKSQFCHGGSVPDVGDLVRVIFASIIIYCFDFTVCLYFTALIGIKYFIKCPGYARRGEGGGGRGRGRSWI